MAYLFIYLFHDSATLPPSRLCPQVLLRGNEQLVYVTMEHLLPRVEASHVASLSSPSLKKQMPSKGFEARSPRPQSKSVELDCSAMGPALGHNY